MKPGSQCTLVGEMERHILVAVDPSSNAKRAVLFVGDFFGCYPSIRVTLLTVILQPDSSYFENAAKGEQWLVEKQAEAERMMAGYREILLDAGFASEKVLVDIKITRGPSVADSIIAELEALKCCTVVVGRRGISKKEEFIFGSTSNKILHEAKNCAVMVIE